MGVWMPHDVNPFDCLTELQKHATELAENPAAWMPWNDKAIHDGGSTSAC